MVIFLCQWGAPYIHSLVMVFLTFNPYYPLKYVLFINTRHLVNIRFEIEYHEIEPTYPVYLGDTGQGGFERAIMAGKTIIE